MVSNGCPPFFITPRTAGGGNIGEHVKASGCLFFSGTVYTVAYRERLSKNYLCVDGGRKSSGGFLPKGVGSSFHRAEQEMGELLSKLYSHWTVTLSPKIQAGLFRCSVICACVLTVILLQSE